MHPAFASVDHRIEPPPSRPWIMTQRWCDLLFAHWPVPPEALARALPAAFVPDLFEGEAWIGVVPFRMEAVRLRGLPAVPGLSAFPELNVRTYVRRRDRPGVSGVYFFSLDARSGPAVAIARAWFGLPYFRAEMRCVATAAGVPAGRPMVGAATRSDAAESGIDYDSVRVHRGAPAAALRARYAPTGPVRLAVPGTLDHFLTERYRLLLVRGGRVVTGEIHHPPWPLQPAEAEFLVNEPALPRDLRLQGPPRHVAFARRLETVEWSPRTDRD